MKILDWTSQMFFISYCCDQIFYWFLWPTTSIFLNKLNDYHILNMSNAMNTKILTIFLHNVDVTNFYCFSFELITYIIFFYLLIITHNINYLLKKNNKIKLFITLAFSITHWCQLPQQIYRIHQSLEKWGWIFSLLNICSLLQNPLQIPLVILFSHISLIGKFYNL